MKQIILAFFLTCLFMAEKSLQNKFISKELVDRRVQFDTCQVCIEFADQALDQLLNAILNIGVVGECSTLCSYVEQKTGSKPIGIVCNILCDIVGVDEFVKIIDRADLDPIYYCELLKSCKIKDDGDATINNFQITPLSGPQGTTFKALLNYVSNNGTGTGEIAIGIQTVDGIDLGDSFLVESQPPGNYEERINIKAKPDPDCDPTEEACEQWLPGLYIVNIAICNGECGSKHPHSKIYAQAISNFTIV